MGRKTLRFAPAIIAVLAACRGVEVTSLDPEISMPIETPPEASVPVVDTQETSGSVSVTLTRVLPGGSVISFGVPLVHSAAVDLATVRIVNANTGALIPTAKVKPLLHRLGTDGAHKGLRAFVVQVPSSVMTGSSMNVEVRWGGEASSPLPSDIVPFSSASAASDEKAPVVDRAIQLVNSVYSLIETNPRDKYLFTGAEPTVVATFPAGYLAVTGILGQQATQADVSSASKLQGLGYLSDYFSLFANGAMYQTGYGVHPDSVLDPLTNFEGWLYDRCATFLTAYFHTSDLGFYRHALRSCSHYVRKIDGGGVFTGKPTPDPKYSHVRGVYAYYALTGDEAALGAATNMAKMWRDEPYFVKPYRAGGARGVDKQWTERLLGTSMEGLLYGFLMTEDLSFMTAFKEMFETAYRHITVTNQVELNAITKSNLPPQNCFIHNAYQHETLSTTEPWCSTWMTELTIDPFLLYQEMTQDPRVDEIFVRLGRFLRDVGSMYFRGGPLGDSFAQPSICFDPANTENPRILIPAYGAGIRLDGSRYTDAMYDDFQHCADATALTAVAIRGLHRRPDLERGKLGSFASELESFMALHHEFSFCAKWTFKYHSRTARAPSYWTSTRLAAGYASGDPAGQATWLKTNKVGYPVYETAPQRKLSWWFNTSMLQFGWLSEAGVDFSVLSAGAVQPAACK